MENNIDHFIKIISRNNVVLNGVNKIINFDDKKFYLESIMGNIEIKGNNLEVIKLDTIDGNVNIKGNIDSVIYVDNVIKQESFVSKLFK